MNRRQLFVSTARAALATAFGGAWLPRKAAAQTGGTDRRRRSGRWLGSDARADGHQHRLT
jgi:hypothetical protein